MKQHEQRTGEVRAAVTATFSLEVGLGEHSYPIHIGRDLLPQIGSALKVIDIAGRYAIISDDQVAALYGAAVKASLEAAGLEAVLITFPHGEVNKNLHTLAELTAQLSSLGFDRSHALLALGGGVTGDLTGFLAAIYMRGIPFVQVPTSLLAQVDSSVGGKTGVDTAQGKNLLGAFYQPRAVFIDTNTLETLPREEFLSGMAEVIKYGAALDADFFGWLAINRKRVLRLDPPTLQEMIWRCCALKADVVEKDEREGDWRRVLNFGHTFGHALELVSGYQLRHGYGVSIGMVLAARLAVRLVLVAPVMEAALADVLSQYGLPISPELGLDPAAIHATLRADKKKVGTRLFFVLPEAMGRVRISDQVRPEDIDAVLTEQATKVIN